MLKYILELKNDEPNIDNETLLVSLSQAGLLEKFYVEDKWFGNHQIEEFCKEYAKVYLYASKEDFYLNEAEDDEIAIEKQDAINKICGYELKKQINIYLDKMLNISTHIKL